MAPRRLWKRRNPESHAQPRASQRAAQRLPRTAGRHGSSRKKQTDDSLNQCPESSRQRELEEKRNGEPGGESGQADSGLEAEVNERGCSPSFSGEDMDGSDWEDGSAQVMESRKSCVNGVTVEFSHSPDLVRRKPPCRASAEEKESAELQHKVHLLCLLARGRLIDRACDDPLIQASLLSLLPRRLMEHISEIRKVTKMDLSRLVHWFHGFFRVRESTSAEKCFDSALAHALETREGTSEEIAALTVALFRALKFTARFVSVLDVISLKPERTESDGPEKVQKANKEMFDSPTPMVAKPNQVSTSSVGSVLFKEERVDSGISHDLSHQTCMEIAGTSDAKTSAVSKSKGDAEFEMQLEMALLATTFEVCENNADPGVGDSSFLLKRLKRLRGEEGPASSQESLASSQVISTAVGASRVGCPLYWAEVYCSREKSTGKWVHVDAVTNVIDGEHKVEAVTFACKKSLRYAVAFAGNGAKDVTRRYCLRWHRIASQRVDSVWWNAVLAPLRELESGATEGDIYLPEEATESRAIVDLPPEQCREVELRATRGYNYSPKKAVSGLSEHEWERMDRECPQESSVVMTRSSLEDKELETRALSEPLPTNQQAYRSHQLYAIERWLTKCQIIHPKDPLLGFCSGYPVYPRASVQTLKTKEKWLREGLQIKDDELPIKVLKRSRKANRGKNRESDEFLEDNSEGNVELYGKWQTEPLQLPPAVNGIVPKNERGQVDVWSDKCLPPGTVHLRLPRIFAVAKRLEIDYATAMVGFEFRNGRATPVYEGIVVCSEFKDVILEAYAEGEERRRAEERKRNEAEATSRWYQLLSSIVTRQRLNNRYSKDGLPSTQPVDSAETKEGSSTQVIRNATETSGSEQPNTFANAASVAQTGDHEHVFVKEDESFDEESSVRTKRCRCGFSVQVEEL
ncbi:DNA repair protein RAD4 [Rhodamnia argentea]|uniref:DNA repair protein RAD4 n=1 Tax=Rhodamnia argentea TaxID=178133 RepID=A0A8B8NJB9_9MYRT|nr:DNA repair protein RAD4 [Rhodamnia argentea]